MSIILAILVFGLLIFIHELGHFIAAKLSGITVYSFSIGFGPAILKKQIGDTLYAIRLLPFGGAVAMKGEIEEEENGTEGIDTEGSFLHAPVLSRMIVAVAGSFMNFMLGLIILFVVMLPVKQIASAEITNIEPQAQESGLSMFKVGDKITRIDDFHVYTYNDLLSGFQLNNTGVYDFTVLRNGEKIKLNDVELKKQIFNDEKAPRYGFNFKVEDVNLGGRMKYAVDNSASFVQSVFVSVKYMVTGRVKTSDMMGTVGITSEISTRAQESMTDMWYFVAFLSINLSVFNMLPFFALDGGKFVFLLWEMITKKPIKPIYEAYLNAFGMFLLLGLFVFVTFNDIVKLIRG